MNNSSLINEGPSKEDGCKVCKSIEFLKCCSKCKLVWYCSTDCQKQDWDRHKKKECEKHQILHENKKEMKELGIKKNDLELLIAKASMDSDNGYASSAVGQYFLYGYGIKIDYIQAAYWFQKSADKGHPSGLYLLAQMYFDGLGKQMDKKIAFELNLKSAKKGFPPAQYMTGVYYQKVTIDHHKAVYWYQLAADQGEKRAHNNLAFYYTSGLGGVDINMDTFVYHIKISAKLGYTLGMCNLGIYYEDKSRYELAIKWYKLAADKEYDEAQYMLGKIYYLGRDKNFDEALKWLTLAGNQDHIEAQYLLGVCYSRGEGIEVNLEKAAKWFKLAKEQGHIEAAEELLKVEISIEG